MTPIQITANKSLQGRKLFLETSAQIFRLVGGSEWRRDIDQLISRADRVGTSRFVLNEFEAVYGKLYENVASAIAQLSYQHRPQPFDELLKSAVVMLSPYIQGGPKLLSIFVSELTARYADRLVTPTEVRNFVLGQRHALTKAFFRGDELFDSSSCCVWETRGLVQCSTGPSGNCRLKTICLTSKVKFLQSVEIVASSNREESPWLSNNLALLSSMDDFDLIEFVGSKPSHFGDIIIFWEAPETWTILTRDKTFRILQERHERNLFVFSIRAYRENSNSPCEVQLSSGEKKSAWLVNYSPTGVLVYSDVSLGNRNSVIHVNAEDINGIREGRIVEVEADVNGFLHRIKLITRRAPVRR